MRSYFYCLSVLLTLALASAAAEEPKPLKVGMIGLDTSHVTAFIDILHNTKVRPELAGDRVVAAFPGGSEDVEWSRTRIQGFTKTVKEKHGVEIVDSIDALLPKVDVVLLESVDGRTHLEQVKPILRAGKRVFIDKPMAGSLADVIEIFDLAKEHKVPLFSCSSLRFSPDVIAMKNNDKVGNILGCFTYGPCTLEPHHPDLFFYGVHGIEALFTLMGPGCESVSRVSTKDTDVATGVWKDGRVGSFRGSRAGKSDYGLVVFGAKAIEARKMSHTYEPLLMEVVRYFRGGEPPVSAEETIELFTFMEAADESKRRDGATVKLADVLAKAREEVARRKAARKE